MGRPRIQSEECAIDGCVRIPVAYNRCQGHYQQWKRSLPYWPIVHGTLNGYRNLHCRCSDCSMAASTDHSHRFVKIGIGSNRSAAVDAPIDYWARFRSYCTLRRRSMRSVALEAIEQYMEANP